MSKNLYGVFAGSRWGMFLNKRDAIRVARVNRGTVRVMPDIPEVSAWDYPTFIVCSDMLADFRKA